MKKYTVKGHWSRNVFADSYSKAREIVGDELTFVNAKFKMAVQSITEEE